MPRRVALMVVLACGVLITPHVVESQPSAGRVPRVVQIGVGPIAPAKCEGPYYQAFVRGLRDRGYRLGETIVVEGRCYATTDDLKKLLTEFIDRKVDVILTGPPEAAVAAGQATKTIPIVGVHGDPIGTRLASSLARPGGNVTGISDMGLQLMAKRIELLKEIVPALSDIAAFSLPRSSGTPATWDEAERAAAALGVTFRFFGVRTSDDLESALDSLSKKRPAALVATLGGGTLYARRQRLIDWALQHRVAAAFVNALPVREGALLSYGTDFIDVFYRLAGYVDKILKGAKPGDLPIEQPTKFELAINLKTAKALGLTIPPSVLLRADEVVQ